MTEKIVKKVGLVGKGSLSVVIPKKWADSMGVKPGDEIGLIFNGSKITLVPHTQEESENVNILIEVDDLDLALRKLIASYVEGVTKVKVRAEYTELLKISERLRENISMFMLRAEPGSKIHEILFNDVKTDMPSTLKLIESITTEVLESLVSKDYEKASMYYKEFMRNYLYFLRNLKLSLAENSIEPYEAIDLLLSIEYIKELVNTFLNVRELTPSEMRCVEKLVELAEGSINSLLAQDVDAAVNTASNILKLLKDIDVETDFCRRCSYLISKISELVLGRCIRNKACRCKHFYPKV
jgi:bifunctional DNA-binding transcriptional regulator/antitoxin component of YhaV-PrlF toxin-antitoxin module